MTTRTAIPASMKRAVRQRCGFGCVICGVPFFVYDHIVEHAEVREHTEVNLTLLCGTHHDQKTRNLISREVIEAANASPFNRKHDYTPPHRLITSTGQEMTFNIGGNIISSRHSHYFPAIALDTVVVLGCTYEDGFVLFDAILANEHNKCILQFRRGEIVIATNVFDYEQVGSSLSVKSTSGQLLLAMNFGKSELSIFKGRLASGVQSIDINSDAALVNDNLLLKGSVARNNGRCGINYWISKDQHDRTYSKVTVLTDECTFQRCRFEQCRLLNVLEPKPIFTDCEMIDSNEIFVDRDAP